MSRPARWIILRRNVSRPDAEVRACLVKTLCVRPADLPAYELGVIAIHDEPSPPGQGLLANTAALASRHRSRPQSPHQPPGPALPPRRGPLHTARSPRSPSHEILPTHPPSTTHLEILCLDTYVPNVQHNNSNKFYFICKFNKLSAQVIPCQGEGEGGGLSVA